MSEFVRFADERLENSFGILSDGFLKEMPLEQQLEHTGTVRKNQFLVTRSSSALRTNDSRIPKEFSRTLVTIKGNLVIVVIDI